MEGDESKSQSLHEDDQISPGICIRLAETVEEFQRSLNEVIEAIEQDENFSELTPENYYKRKAYLVKHLTELSRMHMVLADQHVHLIEEVSKNCPSLMKYQHLDSSDSSSPQVTQMLTPNVTTTQHSESSFSLSSASGSESIMYTNKLQISPVKDDAFKIKESDITTQKAHLETEKAHLETEKAHLETEKAKVIELQKQVADLKLVIANSSIKIKTMEEELETSKKELSADKDVISNLKGERSSNIFQENQRLKGRIQSNQKLLALARKELDLKDGKFLRFQNQLSLAELSVKDNKIKELNTKNDQCMSEISQMESTLKLKEETWSDQIGRLRVELNTKCMSLDDLNKSLKALKLEKIKISDRVATLRGEKCSHDKLTQELETQLKSLQSEHLGVLSSFDNAQKAKNELTLKVLELEREVDRQMEVISDRTEEKMEVIRQLSSSVEHYISRCNELSQSLVANRASCFDFSL